MKRTSSSILFFLLLSVLAHAGAPTSYRQPHPVGWMHSQPTGEMPGWSDEFWMEFELSLANVWNAPFTMIDTRNGNSLEYFADYEQLTAILELGWAIYPRIGVSVELPYAYRGGGELDSIIDNFHILIGNRRFNRQFYERDEYNYSVKTNGVEYYTENEPERGMANVKPKIKFWLWQWMSDDKTSCPCGLAVSAQAKIPVQDEQFAGTTGNPDFYYLLHLGIPIFDSSAVWLTGAYSYLGENPTFKDWPVNRKYQMYEMSIDLAYSDEIGVLFSARAESPVLDRKYLAYDDPSTDPAIVARNRAASGWNSLVYWRGSDAIGIRYRPSDTTQFNFIFAEDWGVGPRDANDDLYSSGAPDANFIIQSRFDF